MKKLKDGPKERIFLELVEMFDIDYTIDLYWAGLSDPYYRILLTYSTPAQQHVVDSSPFCFNETEAYYNALDRATEQLYTIYGHYRNLTIE